MTKRKAARRVKSERAATAPREIRESCQATWVSVDVSAMRPERLREWLETKAREVGARWLLAFADDGVIWGRLDRRGLVTSDALFPQVSPPLRAESLLEARLFSQASELLLWRKEEGRWEARLITESRKEQPAWTRCVDESYILFGTDLEASAGGFTLMRDGAQGLRHAVPVRVEGAYHEGNRPLRLNVRHYLQQDDNGMLRIEASRLLDISVQGGTGEQQNFHSTGASEPEQA